MTRSPTKVPVRKVVAATSGSAVGGATATITVWMMMQTLGAGSVPESVQAAFATLLTAAFTFIAGYWIPES